jgi:hypothetical protein
MRKNYSEARFVLNLCTSIDKSQAPSTQPYSDQKFSTPEKPFSSNSETKEGWKPKFSKYSMINYQKRNYNLINHTVNNYVVNNLTTSKQKGFSDLIDSSRTNNKDFNTNYQQAYQSNPKAFHKHSGEFTLHHDSCIKLSGFGPFFRALS